jgi:hypothetical protein
MLWAGQAFSAAGGAWEKIMPVPARLAARRRQGTDFINDTYEGGGRRCFSAISGSVKVAAELAAAGGLLDYLGWFGGMIEEKGFNPASSKTPPATPREPA